MSQEPARILIVDDLKSNRTVLETLLQALGHVTDTAVDGFEALEKVSRGFDLVMLDVTMPGMDGFEVARRIRQNPAHRDLPIIIVTALDGREDRLRALEAGANDFLAKPVDYTELKVRTSSLLEMTAAQQAIKRYQSNLEELVEQRTTALRQALDEVVSTQERLLEAEREKKQFYRSILRAVTKDKLQLMDAAELVVEGQLIAKEPLEAPAACRPLRLQVQKIAENTGMEAERVSDLLLGVGEAATNALKHAVQGHSEIYVSAEQVTVRICDRGPGIGPDALPASLLVPGFSTKVSMGMGFTVMLNVVDRLCLVTGSEGTTVQLEKAIQPIDDEQAALLALMDRF